MSSQSVAAGKVVLFHYTLTDATGAVLDSSDGQDPMPYLHGAANIVPGLERQMLDRVAGDRFKAVVPPEEGYGLPEGPGPQSVPRDAFPDDLEIEEGMPFMAESEDGDVISLWVTSVEADTIWVDKNHPLAGQTLHFDIEIVEIRDATDEERAHGHPHGAHGDEGHDDDDDFEDDFEDDDFEGDDLDDDGLEDDLSDSETEPVGR